MFRSDEVPAARDPTRWRFDSLEAAPLPAVADPLEGLVAERPPEHTLVGHGLVWTFYASAAATVATFVYRALAWEGWDAGNPVFWVLPVVLLLELWAGRGIQTFNRSGWGVGVFVIALMILGGVTTVLDSGTLLESLAGSGAVVLGGTWMKYLLDRRSDFS